MIKNSSTLYKSLSNILIATMLIYFIVAAAPLLARVWTDSKGETQEATLVRLSYGRKGIVLKFPDGTLHEFPISNLSKEDKAYVQTKIQQFDSKNSGDKTADASNDSSSSDLTTVKKSDTKQSTPAPDDNLVTVIATGYGTSAEQAQKAALRDAVSQVVGTLIDAESRIENDDLIEKILTVSSGYVVSYKTLKVLQNPKNKNHWWAKISATVQKSALANKLTAPGSVKVAESTNKAPDSIATPKPQQSEQPEQPAKLSLPGVGEVLPDQLAMLKQNEKDGLVFLENYFKKNDFPYSLLKISIIGEPEITHKDGLVEFQYKVRMTVDRAKYDAFVKGLNRILDVICLKKQTRNIDMEVWNYTDDNKGLKISYKSLVDSNNPPKNEFNIGIAIGGNLWNVYQLPRNYRYVITPYQFIVPATEIQLLDKEGGKVAASYTAFYKKLPFFVSTPVLFNLFHESNSSCYESSQTLVKHIQSNSGSVFYNESPDIKNIDRSYLCLLAPGGWNSQTYEAGVIFYLTDEATVSFPETDLPRFDHAVPVIIPENKDMDAWRKQLPAKLEELYFNPTL